MWSECHREASIMKSPWSTSTCCPLSLAPKKQRDWKMAQHTATKLNKTGRLLTKSVADGISTCLLVLCSGHKQIDFNRIAGYLHILFCFPTARCALVQCPRRNLNTEMSPAAKFPVVFNFISSTTPPNAAS